MSGELGRGTSTTVPRLQATVEHLAQEVHELKEGNVRLVVSTAKLSVSIEGLSAEVRAILARDKEDIKKLFDLHSENAKQIATVKEHHMPEGEIRQSFAALAAKIEAVSGRVYWICGIGAAIVGLTYVVRTVLLAVK